MISTLLKIVAGLGTYLLSSSFALALKPLQPEDIFALQYVFDPQISPDGSRVVYLRRGNDIMTDTRYANLWISDADGNNHRPLTSGESVSNPRWSPDGTRLAYVSSETGRPQIVVRWMDTGVTTAMTNLASAPGALRWSPDGSKIAFSMFVAGNPLVIGRMPGPPAGAEWAPLPKMTDIVTFRWDDVGEVTPGYTHLFVVSAEGGSAQQVTSGDFHHSGDYVWTPDGGSLIVSADRHEDWEISTPDSDIFEFFLGGGEPKQLVDRQGPDSGVTISPNGNYIAYTGYDQRYQMSQEEELYVAERDGGNPRIISGKLDRSVSSATWSADGRSIYGIFQSEGVTKLARFDLEGRVEVLAESLGHGDFNYGGSSFSISKDGSFAVPINKPHVLSELGVGKKGARLRQITRLNRDLFDRRELGEVEEIWWESPEDGLKIQGWIIKPPQFDPTRKYPLILEIHGGPTANYGPRFDLTKQLLAAGGYVVLYSNPRGSTSYGEKFANAIHHDYPGDDYYDLVSGVDAVIERGYIDENNLFVMGGSGGAVLTSWITSKTQRFRAAMMLCPVVNWESWVFTADAGIAVMNQWMPGAPWDHPENYDKRSLLAAAQHVKTPTLIMTGEEDWRTPMSESEQYYKALRYQGVEAVLVRVPGESHRQETRPSHSIAKPITALGWFDRYRTE